MRLFEITFEITIYRVPKTRNHSIFLITTEIKISFLTQKVQSYEFRKITIPKVDAFCFYLVVKSVKFQQRVVSDSLIHLRRSFWAEIFHAI